MNEEIVTHADILLSPAQQLQFVVRFAYLTLAHLRPGDWSNLREEFDAFFDGRRPGYAGEWINPSAGATLISPSLPPFPLEYSEADFAGLQAEVRAVIHGTVIGPRRGEGGWKPIPLSVAMGASPHPGSDRQVLTAFGHTRDLFLFQLFMLLRDEPSDRIQACPECGTVFYRIKKQVYCSRHCANRVSVRQWRERQAAPSPTPPAPAPDAPA